MSLELTAIGYLTKGAPPCSMTTEVVGDGLEDEAALLASRIVKEIAHVNHQEFGARFVKLTCGKTVVVLELT